METQIQGLVLRTAKQGDCNKILTVLTPSGLTSVIAHGVLRPKSTLAAGCQPFSYAIFQLKKSKGDLLAVHSCDIVSSFFDLGESLEKLELAVDLCKLAARTSFAETDCETSLKFLLNTLHVMQKRENIKIIRPFSLIRYISLIGFPPNESDILALSLSAQEAVYHAISAPDSRIYNAAVAPEILKELEQLADKMCREL